MEVGVRVKLFFFPAPEGSEVFFFTPQMDEVLVFFSLTGRCF